jgi:hypothetical protein
MNEIDVLRRRLEVLVAKTAAAERFEPAAWYGRDRAGERRASDDLRAGRLAWQSAWRHARSAIEALDAGDLSYAQQLAWSATDFYVSALEGRVRPADMETLVRGSARRRGRRPKD